MENSFQQIKYGGLVEGSRPVANIAYFRAGVTGTITELTIWNAAASAIGESTFNFLINGVKKFVGGDRPTIETDARSVTKTGLAFAVTEGDIISFDLEIPGTTGAALPLVFQFKIDDGVSVGGSSPAQTAPTVLTASIADNATDDTTGTLGKYSILSRLTADRACRVRIYQTAAYQTADAARAIGVDPTDEHGVLLDAVIEASNLTLDLSPLVTLCDGETTRTGDLAISITNMSGSTSTVAVTFKLLILEA